jgi:CheY-like chemotaxis protein
VHHTSFDMENPRGLEPGAGHRRDTGATPGGLAPGRSLTPSRVQYNRGEMEQDTLERLVRETLEHLNSRSFLATHRLTTQLGPAGHPLTADGLRQRLLDAIDQLRPVAGPESSPPDWRRYRHLMLRYVEGLNRDQIAHTLGVSLRQASRDHEHAIAALTSSLWVQLPPSQLPRERDGAAPEAGNRPHPVGSSEATGRAAWGDQTGTDVAETVQSAINTLSTLLPHRNVACSVQVPDTLPPIAINRALLRQVILTLVSYAVEVAPGAETVIRGADSPRGVALTIDTREGSQAGPPSSRLAPSRADLPTRARQLLEAAEHLLAQSGGSIQTGRLTGRGPLLTVLLSPVSLRKILVIDDNPDLVTLFRRYLRGDPYRLIQTTSGESAIRLAEDLQPDLIILDVMLPSADGWDTLAVFRQRPRSRHVPVIICTILPEQALAQSLGVSEFLAKPVTQEALRVALERCFR